VKFFIVLILFQFFQINGLFAQEKTLDSLFFELKKSQLLKPSFTKDTATIVLKQKIAWKLKEKNSDSAVVLINEVIDFIVLNFQSSRKKILRELKQKPNSFFRDSKNIFFTQRLGDSYQCLGVFYDIQGNYTKSLHFNLNSLRVWDIIEKSRNDLKYFIRKSKSSSLGNIGTVYEELGEYDKAIIYFNACLELKRKINDTQGIGITLGSIGTTHYFKNDLSQARTYYQKALDIFLSSDDKDNASIFTGNLAVVLMDENKLEEAIILLKKGIEIDKEIQKNRGVASKMGNIGLIYTKLNNYSNAEKYLKEALKLSKKLKITNVELDHHFYLSDLYEKSNRKDLALFHYKSYTILKDRLKNDDIIKKQTLLEAEFEFEKRQDKIKAQQEKKVALIKLEKQKQKTVILLLIVLLIVSAFSVYILFTIYRKRKNEQEILSAKKQLEIEYKLLRTQMNPHFIFNVLNSIHNYINQESNEKASYLLLKFSKLIRNILQHSTKEEIYLDEELKQLELYILIEESRFSNSFTHKIVIHNELECDKVLVPPMLLQPFVENAIIHGLAPLKDRKGELIIDIEEVSAQNLLKISIIDNGIGMNHVSKEDKTHESLSIKLITERLEILNKSKQNSIEFSSLEEGTKVVLIIPFKSEFT
jgi:tetratricopeptide (TPR) repeat protein